MIKRMKVLFLFLIVITFLLLVYSVLYPNIVLHNDTILYGNEYIPNFKSFNLFSNLSDRTVCDVNIDTNTIGEYKVNCKIKYLFYNVNKKFTIHVVDKDKPTITLNGNLTASVCPNKEYREEGFSAYDAYDGDITERVNKYVIDNNIFYTVEDKSGNTNIVKREILFEDKENPMINLIGDKEVYVYLGGNYTEPSYTAYDNCDGDITDKVISTGNVDTTTIGTYTITYEVSDSNDNKTSIERKVVVIKKPSYNNNYYGNGVIYLTFDDGPSYLTSQILDILDEEDIKATFFVTGANENTKRAYNSGHTIALHSYTHDYAYVYSSSDNYFEDLAAVSDRVFNVIGIRPNIIRFPGGSSNTVSRNYSRGIMTYLTSEVVNRGYNYFDWNVDSNDAGSDIYNSEKIYANVVNNISHGKTNVVLMHDSGSHTATVKALRDIIRYGKNNGYSFAAITNDTPVVRHGVNN